MAKTIDIVKAAQQIVSYQSYNPGYNFYLNSAVKKFESSDSLKSFLLANNNSIVISRKEFVDSLKTLHLEVIAEHHDLFELPTTVILKYEKP